MNKNTFFRQPLSTALRGSTVLLEPGQASVVTTQPGQHYQVRKPGAGDAAPDNLIASRRGHALHVRYADGSSLTLESFYTVCQDASQCSVQLAGDGEQGVSLSADSATGGLATMDGDAVVYAHGRNDVLLCMAQNQPDLLDALGAQGDAPVLSYWPQSAPASAELPWNGSTNWSSVVVVSGLAGMLTTCGAAESGLARGLTQQIPPLRHLAWCKAWSLPAR